MFTTKELAKRWGVKAQTLRKWRTRNYGPKFIKLGTGRNASIRYTIDAVVEFENNQELQK